MSPELIAIIAGALVRYGPAVARAIMELFSKPTVTPADWDKVFALAEKSYEDYTKSTTS